MKNVWLLVLVLAAIPGPAQTANSTCPPEGAEGLWSREATYLCPQYKARDFVRDMRIKSPAREGIIGVGYEHWWLGIGSVRISLAPHQSSITDDDSRVTENAEMAWAPDGRAFYLTQTENRAGVQGFYTEVYRINEGRVLTVLNVNRIVQREFDLRHRCVSYDARGKSYSEEADIAAVKWLAGSNRLLMVAETPYDSECTRGYFAGYVVSLSRLKVSQRYSARELMTSWEAVVGDRLKEDFRGLTAKQKDAAP